MLDAAREHLGLTHEEMARLESEAMLGVTGAGTLRPTSGEG
ncbi:MAG TPA: hypothetical protein VI997_07955 [Candidatus Thermoplasmatota archaeon]|nr:hypothetical protein [Candidatus Thermoplasmatota archaeon]